jgi:hypothetical protein
MADVAIPCPSVPSAEAAYRLVAGDASAIPAVLGTMALRGGLIAAGVLLAGQREHVFRSSVAGAIAIEAFVLAWAAYKTHGGGA